jgi:putative PIN family toxin of toxin-antitoxin system
MRVVIDINDYISALIGKKHRLKLEKVLLDKNIEILSDVVLLEEIKEVAHRNKFRKYVSLEEVDRFVELLKYRLKPTIVTTQVNASPDPDDNFCWH